MARFRVQIQFMLTVVSITTASCSASNLEEDSLPHLEELLHTAGRDNCVFFYGCDPVLSRPRGLIIQPSYLKSSQTGDSNGSSLYNWVDPRSGRTFNVPRNFSVYAAPASLLSIQQHLMYNITDYVEWSYSMKYSAFIGIIINFANADADAYYKQMFEGLAQGIAMARFVHTSLQVTTPAISTLATEFHNGSLSDTPFAKEIRLLPPTAATPLQKAEYMLFVDRWGPT